MVRRSGRRSSPRSDRGSGGRKASKHDNYWKVLEGKESEVCKQVLKDGHETVLVDTLASNFSSEDQEQLYEPQADILCVDVVDDRPLFKGRDLFAASGIECENGLDGSLPGLNSCRCVSILNSSAQELNATGQCTSAVCVNASKDISVNLGAVCTDFYPLSGK
ncbi:hypothetical protein M5K25_027601 [Dendrobium thyrsiflorum]|uniref:Uncharacterized protein n=1 Tax=Dendrobium thyrsiflorum TaxID=117978 RepID=A0ABD0TU82_DENTH